MRQTTRLVPLSLVLASAMLVACTFNGGTVPALDYVPTMGVTDDGFELLDVALLELEGGETPERAAARLKERFGTAGDEGRVDERTDVVTDAAGGASAVYTASGLADDSIQAEQYVAEFETDDNGQLRVMALGRRWRCWRGTAENDGWTDRPCL